MSKIAEAAYGDLFYPERPGFKTGGTSQAAARAVYGGASNVREAIYRTIASAPLGLTADPGIELDIVCTVNVAMAAAGFAGIKAKYVKQ